MYLPILHMESLRLGGYCHRRLWCLVVEFVHLYGCYRVREVGYDGVGCASVPLPDNNLHRTIQTNLHRTSQVGSSWLLHRRRYIMEDIIPCP